VKRVIALIAGILLSAPAFSICGNTTRDKDGIACRVDRSGLISVLRIEVYAQPGGPQSGAAGEAIRSVIAAFINEGGHSIQMHTVRNGVSLERHCAKVKHRRTEHCGPWIPVGQ